MNPEAFRSSFDAVVSLSDADGPRHNILEPKFMAREQMLTLRESVRNAYKDSPSLTALSQLCRCHVFLGLNMLETDEETNGVMELRKAYTITLSGANHQLLNDVVDIVAYPLEDILKNDVPVVTVAREFAFATEFMRVQNALGLYLSNRDAALRINDAKKVLHVAERAYMEWDSWFQSLPGSCVMKDIPLLDDGKLDRANVPLDLLPLYITRMEMDTAFTSTVFFLAQVYTACQMPVLAARYCHHTLYNQLLSKASFSKKDWATNVLQLSAFYSSYLDYGKALHCLRAGEVMMPKENADDETLGIVAWAHGKFYLHRLHHYAEMRYQDTPQRSLPDEMKAWWVDFPLAIPPEQPLPAIVTFEDARECFKASNAWLNEALKYYLYDRRCTDHIEIRKDMVQLYAALIHFEDKRDRIIAMHKRRVSLIEQFPGDLSFNAYPTLIRQLLFDLGNMHEEILGLCIMQKEKPLKEEKPLSSKKINELTSKAQSFYRRFCDTWCDPQTGLCPESFDKDSRLPFFQALVRLAQLQTKYIFKNPKEEYDNIATAIKMFQDVIEFASNNPMGEDAEINIKLAQEMVILLPMKQKELWRAYQGAI